MNKRDWEIIGLIASAAGGLAVGHGIGSKKWKDWHTFWTVVGVVAALATLSG